METAPLAAFVTLAFALPLLAAPELHYLAAEAVESISSPRVPQLSLYSGPLDGVQERVFSETFTDAQTGLAIGSAPAGGNRTFIRGLFMDSSTGDLALTGLEVAAFASSAQTFGLQLDLIAGGTITIQYSTPGQLSFSGPRRVRVWKKPNGGRVSPAWAADLPTPPTLPYEGPPYPSPSISVTALRPWLLTENAGYSFARDEVIVPLNRKLYRLSSDKPAEDITPNFNRVTDIRGNDDPAGVVRSFLRTVIDQKHGQLYLSFGARNVEVIETRPADFYDNPETIGNPHLIQARQLALTDNAFHEFLGRVNLDGTAPILFESSVVAPTFLPLENHGSVDPENGYYFAVITKSSANVTTRELVRKPLNRPDSSVLSTFSAASTGNPDFDWTVLATGLAETVDIEVEPVSRRIYYLLQNGQLRSISYEGKEDRLEKQLPASTSDFAIYQPRRAAPPTAAIAFLDDLPFSTEATSALAISGDGRMILGTAQSGDETLLLPDSIRINQAVLQSNPGRPQGLGNYFPIALSRDGRTALLLDLGGLPATWSAATNVLTSSDYGAFWLTQANALSGDGSIVAGAFGNEPGRHSRSAGLMTFGFPEGRADRGVATAVSADGARYAGEATGGGGTEAFLYELGTGYTLLGDLPGGAFFSSATAISPDGSAVAGYSVYESSTDFFGNARDFTRPFLWTAATGMKDLGSLLVDSQGQANDVNDTSTSVGASGGEAFIHHPSTGIISLKRFLTEAYGLDLTGIELISATGISDDNRTVIGRADDNGTLKGFSATLPNFPADALALASPFSASVDQDNDGLSDLLEAAIGSDPFSASSRRESFLDMSPFAQGWEISFAKPPIAASGRFVYRIEQSKALDGDWNAESVTIVEDSSSRLTVRIATGERGFFRLRVANAP